MRAWLLLLAGLILWTTHFFALYILASLFPGTDLADALILAVTVPAGGAALWLALRTGRALGNAREPLERWSLGLSRGAVAIGFVAIVYQALPALIG